MPPQEITTERLLLTPPNLKDVDRIIEYVADPQIVKLTLSIPSEYGEKEAVSWLNHVNEGWKNGSSYVFAVRTRETGEFMGGVGLHLSEKYGWAELGYWIGAPFRRKGYVSEAVGALIDFGFTHLEKLMRIQAIHKLGNDPSGRVMMNNGMVFEGQLEDYAIKDGEAHTVLLYRILRREWTEK